MRKMSKQRPSTTLPPPRPRAGDAVQRAALRRWSARLFKNFYTRRGRRIRLRAWSVKIQHEGRRHTFSLGVIPRPAAARKAYALHRTIVLRGWDAALRRGGTPSPPPGPDAAPGPRARPRYWRRRLLTRRYTDGLRPGLSGELSVRIEHGGESHYFPLEAADEGLAARRAAQIYSRLVATGWASVRQTVPREITVAVFWAMDPLACTYTTLFTDPAGRAARPRKHAARDVAGLVYVVEGDEGVRRAIASCFAPQLEPWEITTLSTAEEVLRLTARLRPALVFLNRSLPDLAGGECVETLNALHPQVPAFTYGIYDESDQLFLSFAGVGAGYILRRRPAGLLLEPLGPVASIRPPAPDQLAQRVRRYFRSFFDAVPVPDVHGLARLTPREQEILDALSKGYVDKEVAHRLGISAWTVHGHLQSIFRKLGVHTRTEAVVKYLQK
jgi:DNA-binding NarL/FixJ family response regulator